MAYIEEERIHEKYGDLFDPLTIHGPYNEDFVRLQERQWIQPRKKLFYPVYRGPAWFGYHPRLTMRAWMSPERFLDLADRYSYSGKDWLHEKYWYYGGLTIPIREVWEIIFDLNKMEDEREQDLLIATHALLGWPGHLMDKLERAKIGFRPLALEIDPGDCRVHNPTGENMIIAHMANERGYRFVPVAINYPERYFKDVTYPVLKHGMEEVLLGSENPERTPIEPCPLGKIKPALRV